MSLALLVVVGRCVAARPFVVLVVVLLSVCGIYRSFPQKASDEFVISYAPQRHITSRIVPHIW